MPNIFGEEYEEIPLEVGRTYNFQAFAHSDRADGHNYIFNVPSNGSFLREDSFWACIGPTQVIKVTSHGHNSLHYFVNDYGVDEFYNSEFEFKPRTSTPTGSMITREKFVRVTRSWLVIIRSPLRVKENNDLELLFSTQRQAFEKYKAYTFPVMTCSGAEVYLVAGTSKKLVRSCAA
jgi:hypothetical protein